MKSYAIHWFRRDLRVRGNPALDFVRREFRGRVLGVFFIDSKFLSRKDFSHDRFQFFLETIAALRSEFESLGGQILVIDAPPAQGFPRLLDQLRKKLSALPSTISFNRDYEPFAVSRDAQIRSLLENLGVRVHTDRDHILIEPSEVQKSDGTSDFKVFTPYSKAWLKKLHTSEVRRRLDFERSFANQVRPKFSVKWNSILGERWPSELRDSFDRISGKNEKHVGVPLPVAGHAAALSSLRKFRGQLENYGDQRDIPSIPGTSRLSIYLKNGSLTVAQVITELGLDRGGRDHKTIPKFLNELIWREFYYSILHHFPYVEHSAFRPKYDAIQWENNESYFKAWTEGLTGYPLVDAGMRQLSQTGWMHNRVRMIVASFLVKDLQIDWRWGERYFMNKLLDGDLAPNNGGWQWAASTGADPQPYFRIFNPTLQSKRFDPDGDYIRRWVPELKSLDRRRIHAPSRDAIRGIYPEPIVVHASRAMKAIRLFSDL